MGATSINSGACSSFGNSLKHFMPGLFQGVGLEIDLQKILSPTKSPTNNNQIKIYDYERDLV